MALPSSQSTREWAGFTVVIGSRVYRTMLLTLVLVAVAPTLLGWQAYVIKTGSMNPSIAVGDVALGRPFKADEKVDVGRVYMFQDPAATGERTLVHRIVERSNDGEYVTQGDANATPDTALIGPADLTARGVLLVPYVGLPIVWLQTGQWVLLGLWLLLTAGAFFLATRNVDGEPPKWTMRRLILDELRRTPKHPAESEQQERVLTRRAQCTRRAFLPRGVRARGGRGVRAMVATLLVCVVGTTALGTANATFTGTTRNSANTFTAGNGRLPYVAAVTADGPKGFWLLDEVSGTSVRDYSRTYSDGTTRDGTVQRGLPGAHTARNPGTSFRFAGGGALLHPSEITPPTTHTLELWFRTTSAADGYLIGFQDQNTLAVANYNRTVHIDGGKIVVGNWSVYSRTTVTTPARYDDGRWHHLVVTSTGSTSRPTATIYLNGVQVAQGTTTALTSFGGQWQIGKGRRAAASVLWPFPSEVTFQGDIDAVSVFDKALTPARVKAHYDAR